MKKIDNYDFGFLKDRFEDDYPHFAGRFDEAVIELKKFLSLPLTSDGPLAAMSHCVDALWHTFIQHTPQYMAFGQEMYGRNYLHHQPRSQHYPVPVSAISNFYTDYPKQFGPVPDIWFEDIPPAHVIAVSQGQVPLDVQNLKWSGWPGWTA